MTTEYQSPAFHVGKLSLPGSQQIQQGYYRSKLFVVHFSSNPLVAAAGPLLSLLERLCLSPSLPPISNIRENIEHELRAFHSCLNGKAYAEEFNTEFDVLAHYLLCATIDELLGKSYVRLYGKPAEFQAFTPLSFDQIGPEERFFHIIEYIKERPNQYLDLIELAYYCLITGFEGKQHHQPDGRLVLDNLIEELFQLIQQHRVNKAHHLFKDIKKIPPLKSHKHLLTTSLISLGLLIASYAVSYMLLQHDVKAVQFGRAVAKLDD